MHCFCILIRALYLPFKLLRPRHKVVFISRQGNRPSKDFLDLADQLRKQDPELKIVILCKFIEKGILARIAYGFHILHQMYHLATSKACVLDGYCIAACVLRHHKELKIYQIWHAVGLLKNFGHAVAGLSEGFSLQTARIMRMHRGYHRIVCSSESIVSEIARCYDADEDQFLPLGLPRLDFLTDKERLQACRTKILETCPLLKGEKKIILYAPTFRKATGAKQSLVKSVDLSRYHLVEKSHSGKVKIYTEEGASSISDPFSGVEWISIADYVVTDYSAILFEALAADRPVILFCYDLEDYIVDRGFAIDYNAIPLPVCKTAEKVVSTIEQEDYDKTAMDAFCGHYVSARRYHCTKAIAYVISEEIQGREVSYEQISGMERFRKKKEVYHV